MTWMSWAEDLTNSRCSLIHGRDLTTDGGPLENDHEGNGWEMGFQLRISGVGLK
jgi:hypothetical protein